jgi:hypothetical protein
MEKLKEKSHLENTVVDGRIYNTGSKAIWRCRLSLYGSKTGPVCKNEPSGIMTGGELLYYISDCQFHRRRFRCV